MGFLLKMTFKRAFGFFTLLAGMALAIVIVHSYIFSLPYASGEGMPLSALLLPAFFIGIGFSWSRKEAAVPEEARPIEAHESWSDPLTYAPLLLTFAIFGASYFLIHALSSDSLKRYCMAAGLAAIAIGVLLDLNNLQLDVRRTLKGEGSSGIPILPFVFYGVGVAIRDQWLHTGYRPLLWLFVFHLSSSFVIPFAFGWFHFREERARAVHARKRLK